MQLTDTTNKQLQKKKINKQSNAPPPKKNEKNRGEMKEATRPCFLGAMMIMTIALMITLKSVGPY